jgi:hypothetical protein
MLEKLWYYFHPENEFVYLGMLAIALLFAVIFKGKRTVKEIWGEMWPKLLFIGAVYAVVIIIIWKMQPAA